MCVCAEFCQPSRRTHARIKNCKFFGPNESKSLFYSAHMYVCVYAGTDCKEKGQ